MAPMGEFNACEWIIGQGSGSGSGSSEGSGNGKGHGNGQNHGNGNDNGNGIGNNNGNGNGNGNDNGHDNSHDNGHGNGNGNGKRVTVGPIISSPHLVGQVEDMVRNAVADQERRDFVGKVIAIVVQQMVGLCREART